MWVCKKCGSTNSNNASSCSRCGEEKYGAGKGRQGHLTIAIIVSLVFVLLVTAVWNVSLQIRLSKQKNPDPQIQPSPVAESVTPSAVSEPAATTVEDLRVMFFSTEIQNDITVWADDPIDLTVKIIPQTSSSFPVECVADSPEILTIEQKSGNMFRINCVDNGTLPKSCKMTFKCADIEKIFTVYCRPEK